MRTDIECSPSRVRFNKALDFDSPDAIPVIYHPSPGGLYVHGTALLELFNRYPPDNAVTFTDIPRPGPEQHDEAGRYRELKTDAWGTTWEHRIYGVAGHVHAYPIGSWREGLSSYAFPSVPPAQSDVERQISRDIDAAKRDRYVVEGWVSLFEKMHALRPMDELLMDLVMEEPSCLEFLDRLEAYWQQVIGHLIRVGADAVMFGDDWGTQRGPIVSPDLFRKHFLPRYQRLMVPLRQAGRRVFFHTCGRLDSILDDILAMGVDAVWPQLSAYDDRELADKCQNAGVTLYLHPDRQHLIPRGTPDQIEQAIAMYARRYHALRGGGIFYVEIEGDAPSENIRTLIESIHRYR